MIRPQLNIPLDKPILSEHIDYDADKHMVEAGKVTVIDRYLIEGETSPQHAYMRCASAFASSKQHALRMYSYMKRQWFGPASPVLANAPVRIKFFEDFERNFSHEAYVSVYGPLPISCYTGYVPDSRVGIADHYQEMLWIASNGGGYASDWSPLRQGGATTSTGGVSGGLVPFFHVTDSLVTAAHQGSNRRAVYGGNIRCDHPEVIEFIESRKMSGDPNKRSRNVFQALKVTDKFMYAVLQNKPWDLVDNKGKVVETIQARDLWELAMELMFETGGPFIVFEDTCKRMLPEEQKELGLDFNNVNICTEITLANNEERTAVCCLSSYNMLKHDEWKDNEQFIFDCVEFLDNVLEYFIQNALYSCTKDFDWSGLREVLQDFVAEDQLDDAMKTLVEKRFMGLRKAVHSAKSERAIGLGSMGWDSYFKTKMLPYESTEALEITYTVTKWVKETAVKASYHLGDLRGHAPDMFRSKRRNSHLCVTGDTQLLTKQGQVNIIDLIGKEVDIWNGSQWSTVTPFKTGENRDILRVTLDNGKHIDCTPDHRWLVKNDRSKKATVVETAQLRVGDKLDKWSLPEIQGTDHIAYPYTSGFFTGDGSYNQSKPQYVNCHRRKELRLFADKTALVNVLDVKQGCSVRTQADGSLRMYIPDECLEKFEVPSSNVILEHRLLWLAGLFDSDGCSQGSISSVDLDFLKQVQDLGISCGLQSRISTVVNPTGFTGQHTYYTISFVPAQLYAAYAKGLRVNRVQFKNSKPKSHYTKVVSIVYVGKQDTYCLTDPIDGTALFNGVKTKQCADAPTATNSLICGGVTPSREPRFQNIYPQQCTSATFQMVEPELAKVLDKYNKNTYEVRKSIEDMDGSVQHLDFLDELEKKVFRTAYEVDQLWIVEHVAAAQQFVCQAISTNLFFRPDVPRKYVNAVHFQMWKKGCKSRYYIRSKALATSNALAKKVDSSIMTIDYNRADIFQVCLSCEG